MGLSLLGGAFLLFVIELDILVLVIRLCRMTLGSAEDPSSLTFVSPNTDLERLRKPDAAEFAAPVIFSEENDAEADSGSKDEDCQKLFFRLE